MKINVLSLFDGISCCRLALEKAGIEVGQYYASEIDQFGISIVQKNRPTTIQVGDINKLHYSNGVIESEFGKFEAGQIDLVTFGFCCQSFSNNGKGGNFDDPRGKLFFEAVRLLREVKPKYFLAENVVMKQEWIDEISRHLGTRPIKINSSLVSAQNRPRLYWSNLVPDPIVDRGVLIKDILETKDEGQFRWLQASQIHKMKNGLYKYQSMYHLCDLNGKSKCILSGGYCNSSDNKVQVGDKIRYLTNLENERLQTLPEGWTKGIPESRRKFSIGNGWTVDVITEFFKKIEA